MPEPTQLSLRDNVLHGVTVCSATYLDMGNFMPLSQTQNLLKTADMEGLKGFLRDVGMNPGLTAGQDNGYTDGIVNGNFSD